MLKLSIILVHILHVRIELDVFLRAGNIAAAAVVVVTDP